MEQMIYEYENLKNGDFRLKKHKNRALKVLIVEDDITYEPFWSHILHKVDQNACYAWASSVSEAKDALNRARETGEEYDLVICDIFLSGSKTGIDFLRERADSLEGKLVFVSSVDYLKMTKLLVGREIIPCYIKKPLVIADCFNVISGMVKR